ncbi:hypothetical protein [Ralstonia mojiangensis]|uniref:hypothetical protein n=1 Tax=Ralstonia mojiangensis TaxID=2953895 RepID=UPI00209195E3|nr:hypothetical protein [Ralstonia mojiangensis]MCO5413499.1 hypothetical protein [Ralstonia mojiangensis]
MFEGIAVAFTIFGTLSYAIGRTLLDAWAETAGIPVTVLHTDFYDTMLIGAQRPIIWRTAAILIVVSVAYVWASAVIPDWWAKRNATIRRKRRRQDGRDHLGVRQRFATEARLSTKGVPVVLRSSNTEWLRWKVLGLRGRHRKALLEAPKVPAKPVRRITQALFLTIFATVCLGGIYFLVRVVFLKPAMADGAQSFAKVYVAVTGHIPYQYTATSISADRLKSWACEGVPMLATYRTVELPVESDSSGKKEVFYVLQGAGSTFVLLGQNGSSLRSFGDNPFNLPESQARPLSTLAQTCPRG